MTAEVRAAKGRSPLLELYYLGTPLFALADLALGVPIRAAGLEDPPLRVGYYALAFLLGLVVYRWPDSSAFVGMGESAVNLAILMVSLMTAVYGAPEAVAAG